MANIKNIKARSILDSRGNPTVEAEAELTDGSIGVFSTPSGLSTGKYEALELRDQNNDYFRGLGVTKSLTNIKEVIEPKLLGASVEDQKKVDEELVKLDGTENKKNLGANTTLAVSCAIAKAQASSLKIPLFKYIAQIIGNKNLLKLPKPMFNIINGGKHASFNVDFQEFMVVPDEENFSKNLEAGVNIYYSLKEILSQNKKSVLTGDEGGFAPSLEFNNKALDLLSIASEKAGLKPKVNVFFSIDSASSSFSLNDTYKVDGKNISKHELMKFYIGIKIQYDLLSLEDPFIEDDWDSWASIVEKIGDKTKIVGDDLTVTNSKRLEEAINKKACNAVIVKPNQIGTLSESIEFVKKAKEANFTVIVSHRSGETNDDFVSDFAVGVGADYAKFGAPARGERVAKYNRLLKIEQSLS